MALDSSFFASELPAEGLAVADSGFFKSAPRTLLPVLSVGFVSADSSGFFETSTGFSGFCASCS